MPIKFLLLTACLLDFATLSRPKISVPFSLLLLFAAWRAQRPVLVWEIELPAPAPADVVTLMVIGFTVFILIQTALYEQSRYYRTAERNSRLNETADRLTEANLGFQKYALTVGNSSILEERNRFSREVHDTIGYTLTNLIIMIEACQDLMKKNPEGLQHMLLRAGELAQDGLSDTRRALHALRRLGVRELRGIPAMDKLVQTFRNATGVEVAIEYGNIPWNMTETLERTLYRFIQEGMTNAFKHGRATKIYINLWMDERSLIINLRDNGRGSKVIKEGIGISGMRERVEELGGVISAGNVTDGFKLSARIPVERVSQGNL
jgi:signal transduction histidine kinase